MALVLLSGQASRSRTIALRPNEVPEGAKDFRLTIRRTDGQPFTTQANSALYVGIAFGPTLIKLKATLGETRLPRALTVEIEDVNAKWNPAPRAGDTLLVAVYRPNNWPRVAGPGSFACWAARSAASDEPGGYSGVGTDAPASVPTRR